MNVNFATNNSQKVVNIWDDDTTLADEGGYFVATNPTVSTGIAMAIQTTDSATAPGFLVANTEVASNPNGVSLYLRYLRIICDTVPASSTSMQYVVRMDQGNKYSSGGSSLTPLNASPNSSRASKAAVYFGAVTAAALTSNARLLGRGILTSAIPVLLDQYTINFGAPSGASDMLSGGTGAKNLSIWAPPIIVPPGWTAQIDFWMPANTTTAGVWEVEFCWAERQPGL